MTTDEAAHQPILIDVYPEAWQEYVERTANWFDTVLTAQVAFRSLAEDTLDSFEEPHIYKFLERIVERAQTHEEQAERLYGFIGKKPSKVQKLAGSAMAKMREGLGTLLGGSGGASERWQNLHQLYLASLNAMSAFGAAEQLGLALGNREIATVGFEVAAEKYSDHLLIQEVLLEMVPPAILYEFG